jgi:hypothetical protein
LLPVLWVKGWPAWDKLQERRLLDSLTEVVGEIEANRLHADKNGVIVLPPRYARLCLNGRAYIDSRSNKSPVLFFPTDMLDRYKVAGYVYDKRPGKQDIWVSDSKGGHISSWEHPSVRPHWYQVYPDS